MRIAMHSTLKFLLPALLSVFAPVTKASCYYRYYYGSYYCYYYSSYYYYYYYSYYDDDSDDGLLIGGIVGGIVGLLVLSTIIGVVIHICKKSTNRGLIVQSAVNPVPTVVTTSSTANQQAPYYPQPGYGYPQPQGWHQGHGYPPT